MLGIMSGSQEGAGRNWRPQSSRARELARTAFVTEESVYGVILVSGMIVVAGGSGTSAWQLFWQVAVTVVVFWAAHVYAGTVARHGLEHDRVRGLGEAFQLSVRRSLGLLASSAIPLVILLLGATDVVEDSRALWAALWAGVLVLAVLGWIAFARRGATWPIRVAGALGTAAFGLVMMLLKALIH